MSSAWWLLKDFASCVSFRWCRECSEFCPETLISGSRPVSAQPLDQHERPSLRCLLRRSSPHPCGVAGVAAGRWVSVTEWLSPMPHLLRHRFIMRWHFCVCFVSEVDATCSDFDFGTALHIAAANLCTTAVRCLLELGANPAFRVCTTTKTLKGAANTFIIHRESLVGFCPYGHKLWFKMHKEVHMKVNSSNHQW